MPVRSLHSSVLKWPDRETVDKAVKDWAYRMRQGRPDIVNIGYFGSYAREKWGVGSDIDLVIIVSTSNKPFLSRPLEFDATSLPVPADILVYTEEEWFKGTSLDSGYISSIASEIVWVFDPPKAQ